MQGWKPSYLWNKQFDLKEKFQIDLFCYYDWIYDTWDMIANSITSFNFIIIEKLTELIMMFMFIVAIRPSPFSHLTSG